MSNEIDSILDAVLDDIADLPEFAILQAGVHRVTVSFDQKKIGEHPAAEMKMKLVETVELSDPKPDDVPQAAGTECAIAFMLDNEFGLGNLKKVLAPLGEATGQASLRDIMLASNGMECMVVIGHRKDKTDPDKVYMQVKKFDVI